VSNRLFILAHPDDEMLCLPLLLDVKSNDYQKTYLLYLTLNNAPLLRRKEMFQAVNYLQGVFHNLHLIESEIGFNDGFAWREVQLTHIAGLIDHLVPYQVSTICTFAYEGGHQDHDLANVIARLLKEGLGVKLEEFSGYRLGSGFPFLHVLNPIVKGNSLDFNRSVAIKMFLRLMAIHKSQYQTWIVLGPLIIWKLLFRNIFTSQSKGLRVAEDDSRYLYQLRRKAIRLKVEESFRELRRDGL
jgi:LmbE family N-acetylglucosaminyl deacetylase